MPSTMDDKDKALLAFCEAVEKLGLPLLGPASTRPEYHELDEPYLLACAALSRAPVGACEICDEEVRRAARKAAAPPK